MVATMSGKGSDDQITVGGEWEGDDQVTVGGKWEEGRQQQTVIIYTTLRQRRINMATTSLTGTVATIERHQGSFTISKHGDEHSLRVLGESRYLDGVQ